MPKHTDEKDILRMIERDVIDKYLGVPFLHRGRTMAGFDCAGLLIAIYEDLGFNLWGFDKEYNLDWSKGEKQLLIEDYHEQWVKTPKPTLFDVILFKNKQGIVNHGGVCLSGEKFIQCSQRVGTVVKRWTEEHWVNCLDGFYHLKERDLGRDGIR